MSFSIATLADVSIPLRLDPVDRPGLVEIAGITIRSAASGEILWRARTAEAFNSVAIGNGVRRLPHQRLLVLLSTGDDPQLFLPLLNPEYFRAPVKLELWMRFEPVDSMTVFTLAGAVDDLESVSIEARNRASKATEDLVDARHELGAKVESLKASVLDLEIRQNGLIAEKSEMEVKCSELEKDIFRARAALAESERRAEQSARAVVESEKRVEQSARVLAKANGDLERLNFAINEIHQTLPWRLMEHWRVIAAKLHLMYDCHWIRRSGLFDGDYYLAQNPDIAQAGVDPLLHFLRHGAAEGRRPSLGFLFDSSRYLQAYPDVKAGGSNPLLHFMIHGWREGRVSNPELPPAPVKPLLPPAQVAYEAWQRVNTFSVNDRAVLEQQIRALKVKPLISVVMPVYKPDIGFLKSALQSLADQVYDRWELCVALDGPQSEEVAGILDDFCVKQGHGKLTRLAKRGGISVCSNAAEKTAAGDWLMLLDQDDLLTPDALAEFALLIESNPKLGVIYSDNDKIDFSVNRFDPEFKPEFSPELLLSYMYFGHALAMRRSLFESVHGLRSEYDGSQDYDLALRMVETGCAVGHIPRVLYHWRAHPDSTAASGKAKPGSIEAGRRAVENAIQRRGVAGVSVVHPEWAAVCAVGIFELKAVDQGPAVTIIIPTRNNVGHLRRCLESLSLTAYKNWRVIVADDASDDPATLDYLKGLSSDRFTVFTRNRGGSGFSFSALVNDAAARCNTEFILLLNDDTEVVEPQWLSQMMAYGQIQGVGAVGAKLLYPDKRVQHAGVILGMNDGLADHAFRLLPHSLNGYLSYAVVARNYSCVTAACMLTRATVFAELGGFDAARLAVAYNDVDYCMRLETRGYRSVYVPGAVLIHHEGASRGRGIDLPREEAFLRQRIRRHGADRYYNPNLSLNEPFCIVPRKLARTTGAPVKVLAVTPWLNHTGAPLQQFAVISELASQGSIDAKVLSPSDGPLRAAYEARGIAVETQDHPLRQCGNRQDLEQITERLAVDLKSRNIQVVYATTIETFYYVMAAHKAGISCIWSIHESVDWRSHFAHLPPDMQQAVGECFQYPYRLVFVSRATADLYRNAKAVGEAQIIHNGIDPRLVRQWKRKWSRDKARRHLGIGPDDVVVLSVGTVCERKMQQELVGAFSALDQGTMGKIKCFIVGDRPGTYSTQLHQAVAGLPEEKRRRIWIIPETDDVALYYRAADIFVCTSRNESYPLTILEAIHMGLPVISTPVFGISEQVRNGVNGILYTPGQTAELTQAIDQLANNPDECIRLKRNGRHMLKRLNTFKDMLASHNTLFQEASQVEPS